MKVFQRKLLVASILRKTFLLLILTGATISTKAQIPEGFNYQAVVRDNAGMIIPDQVISVQLAVVQSSPNGLVKFIEDHLVSTNQFGLIKLTVGQGTPVSGEFASVDWETDLHFLRVSMDTDGGNNFQILGTTQLMSVPYAMYAKNVEFDQVNDADADPNNEIQTLVIANDTLFITEGNYVVLSQYSPSPNTDEQTISINGDQLSISNGNTITLVDNVTDADSSPSNEIQNLFTIGDSLFISDGNYVVINDEVNDADSDVENELQEVWLAGNNLSLSNSNTSVDLSPYFDNTDEQSLTLSGDQLTISNGNTVDLNSISGGQFQSSGNIVSNGGDQSSDDLVFGAPTLEQNGNNSHYAKFFFDKSKFGAFRTGYIQSDRWNADSIGNASFAAGFNTMASGPHSTAFGRDALAKGANSVAMGRQVTANGFASFAFGFDANANFNYSFAGGNNVQSNGTNAFAFGQNVLAQGNNSISIGKNVTSNTDGVAMGNNAQAPFATAIAIGRNANSSLTGSISMGEDVNAIGARSLAMGFNLRAPSYGEVVLGFNNTNYTAVSAELINSNDRLFTIGNGVNTTTLNDAFIIYKDGDAFLAGNVVTNSDERLKREVKPLQGSLGNVMSLNGYTFKWNDKSPRDQDQLNTGLIAQEVELLFPELVSTGPNGYKTVNYIALIPHLIESIKAQSLQIEGLSLIVSQQQEEIHTIKTEASLLAELMKRIGSLEEQLILGNK